MTAPPDVEPVRPWPLDTAVLPSGWDAANLTAAQAAAVQIASTTLWNGTAKQYGLRDVIARPACAARHRHTRGRLAYRPTIAGGVWINTSCLSIGRCSCEAVLAVPLPLPVYEILEVLIGADILPEAAYTFDGRRLLRTDGNTWPATQRLDVPIGQPDTWAVTYTRGAKPPAGGRRAVTVLAVELDKAARRDKSCRLPDRVQTLTREGVTMQMLDPMEFLSDGRTGIGEVDRWLREVNPLGLREPAAFYSPDVPMPR